MKISKTETVSTKETESFGSVPKVAPAKGRCTIPMSHSTPIQIPVLIPLLIPRHLVMLVLAHTVVQVKPRTLLAA